MAIHLDGKKGDVAETVLLPGDPLRAKYVAEKFLENPVCYNSIRSMFGFTGTYKGKRVSVQGTGMGLPSLSIYVTELIQDFGAKQLIRIGSCGAIQPDIKVRDVIIAMSASTNSQINKRRFGGLDYAPTATFELLSKACQVAKEKGTRVRVGSIFSSDTFYEDDPDSWKLWADYGVLALEMETSALYTLAAKYKVSALTILTVSDSLISGEHMPASEKEQTFDEMFEIALELA